jgi:hypothetical protein
MRKRNAVLGVIGIVAIASSAAFVARTAGSQQPGNTSLFDINAWPTCGQCRGIRMMSRG